MDAKHVFSNIKNQLSDVKALFSKFVHVNNRISNLCSESEIVVLPPDYLSKVEFQSTKNETSVEHIVAVKSKIGDAGDSTINIGAMVPAENIGISYLSDGARSTADSEATQNSYENIPNASGCSKEDLRNNARFLTVNIAPKVAETVSYDDIADGTRSIVDSESTESLFDTPPKSSANASGYSKEDLCGTKIVPFIINNDACVNEENHTELTNFFYYLSDDNDIISNSNEAIPVCENNEYYNNSHSFNVEIFHDQNVGSTNNSNIVGRMVCGSDVTPKRYDWDKSTNDDLLYVEMDHDKSFGFTSNFNTDARSNEVPLASCFPIDIGISEIEHVDAQIEVTFGSQHEVLTPGTSGCHSDGGILNKNALETASNVKRKSSSIAPSQVAVKTRRGGDKTKYSVPTSDQGSKKLCCIFCLKRYPKLARHILAVHKNEEDVKVILALPPNSKERLGRLNGLRKFGEFEWNMNEEINKDKQLQTSRRTNKKYKRDAPYYETCANCLGSYSPKVLRYHWSKCTNKQFTGERVVKEKSRQVEIRAHAEACDDLSSIVYPSMRNSAVTLAVQFDWIVTVFANNQCLKLKLPRQLNTIRGYLRNAGKLLIAARSICSEISEFASLYNVRHCDVVVKAIRIVAKYDDKIKAFKSPGTAAALVTLVNKISDELIIEYMRLADEEKEKMVCRFVKVFQQDARNKINKMVILNRLKARRAKHENIPKTEDVEKLATYIDSERKSSFMSLSNHYSPEEWLYLLQLTSMSLLVYNRKRVGDVQYILVEEFSNREMVDTDDDMLEDSMFEDRNDVIKSRMKIEAKLYSTVFLLLKDSVDQCLELILRHRKQVGVPDKNEFLFGLPSKAGKIQTVNACVLLREFSNLCGADNPSSLRGTNLRKHFASLCGTMDLPDAAVKRIAKFMGHSDNVHFNIYRHNSLQHDVIQMSQLLEMAQGKKSAIPGKKSVIPGKKNSIPGKKNSIPGKKNSIPGNKRVTCSKAKTGLKHKKRVATLKNQRF